MLYGFVLVSIIQFIKSPKKMLPLPLKKQTKNNKARPQQQEKSDMYNTNE